MLSVGILYSDLAVYQYQSFRCDYDFIWRERRVRLDFQEKLNDFKGGVPGVLSDQTATPRRPLSKRERALLTRWCGTDDDAVVLEARSLFNGTIVGIERSEGRNACND
jgi:hypothetical protein